ncbi:MAG: hypothetical protein DRP09_22075 [Candidatus Thorarchaeota archaeon]|nr:MAG: hypothetical protein DRP09_22075 [Candidatus Thorarchaeota archaeon]
MSDKLILDLTSQAQIANVNKRLEKRILVLLKQITDTDAAAGKHKGALIVLGEFVRFDYKIPGLRQIGSNPLRGTALYVTSDEARERLEELLHKDGAIIIDTTGQIMAAQVMLQVDHAEAEVEEECSTRHIAAASFSMREHIIACFTMSEETGKVRQYVDGKQIYVYDPQNKDSKDEQVLL